MIDTIKSFIKDRPAAVVFFVTLLISAAVLATLQGCNLASLVKVEVPPAVRIAVQPPADVSLDNVDIVWEDWKVYVQSNTAKLQRGIDNANERYAVIKQVVDIGISSAGGELSGIPGGTILLSGLSLLTGLFLKRPGEDSRVAKEKEASYNKGVETGSNTAKV